MTAEKQYNVAIKEFNRLTKKRQDPSFWMANIVDSVIGMSENIGWQNFYSYLANDKHIFQNIMKKTLGECVDEGEKYPPSEVEFEITSVQNGDVTHMKMVPILCTIDKKHEPVVSIPEILSRQTSEIEFKRSNA
jgi:hypothetical protein